MNKTKISARQFINLLARNNNYEAAFYYMTQSGTQINESILSDDLIQTLTQNAKDQDIPRLCGVSSHSRVVMRTK